MKILIIAPASTQDIVFATPVIRAIKIRFVNTEVHCRISDRLRSILEDNPYVDRLLDEEKSIFSLISDGSYMTILDFEPGVSSMIAGWISRVPVWRFGRQRLRKWLYSSRRVNRLSRLHKTDRWLGVLADKGIKGDGLGLDYFVPERDQVPQSWLPEEFRNGYVLFHIGADYATRKLPGDRIVELCDKINKPVLLLGRKEDVPVAEQIRIFFEPSADGNVEEGLLQLNKRTVIFQGAGKFSINQQAHLASQATAIFTFDSEMVAIGSAFRKQIYLLLGNTVLSFGEYPYQTRFVILENNKVSCRPCSGTGYRKCPLKHFKCMREIAFDF